MQEGGIAKNEHNLFTRFPIDPRCNICWASELQKATRGSGFHTDHRCDALEPAKCSRYRITADHAILNEGSKSAEEENLVACIIQDAYTGIIGAYPCPTKSAVETTKSFQRYLGPDVKAKHVYTDNLKEFQCSLADLAVSHDTCTPYTPATNGIAERAVRRVKEGTSACLVQSGLADGWCHNSVQCFCFPRNVVGLWE